MNVPSFESDKKFFEKELTPAVYETVGPIETRTL